MAVQNQVRREGLWLERFGGWEEEGVLRWRSQDEAQNEGSGKGKLWVEVKASPINPADLNVLEGRYGVLPELPAVPGNEGVGVVRRSGDDTSVTQGEVVVLSGQTWQSHLEVSEEEVISLGMQEGEVGEVDEVLWQQLAMLKVNPATAWGMLGQANENGVVVQNAGNSGVGLAVIQLGRLLGKRVVSLVRSEAAKEVCLKYGADAVFLDEEDGVEQAKAWMKDEGLQAHLGLNAVGGVSAIRVMSLLGESAKLLTYGAMSKQALKVPNRFLLFSDLKLEGFWVRRWYESASKQEVEEVLQKLAGWMREGKLRLPVAASFELSQYQAALRQVEQGSGGKVLFVSEK